MMYVMRLLLILIAFSTLKVNAQFFEEDSIVTDVRNNVFWYRCSLGQVWDSNESVCSGQIVKLNHDEIQDALKQASEQLGGIWRLPTLEELESLVCEICDPPKIKTKYFPNISPEAYWTSKPNFFNRKMYWSVNFMTGHNYSRFFYYQQLPVLIVKDR